MFELASFADKWQTLIGAIVGGIFSLLVALLVAYQAQRREDLAAGMLVVGNLATVTTALRTLEELAASEKIGEEDLPYWFSEKLVRRRITLSPLFEASRIRLMPVDVYLAAHLELFQVVFTDIEAKLDMLTNDFAAFDSSKKTTRNAEILKADARVVLRGFRKAAEHAECAQRILVLKVLSPFPTFHSLRIGLFRTEKEKACKALLIKP